MNAFHIPDEPDTPAQIGQGKTYYRYEDVSQDGRLRLEGMWASMGRILWTEGGIAKPLTRLAEQGIRAILSRVVMIGGDDPISAREPAQTTGKSRLEHSLGASGEVDRIMLSNWFETRAPRRASQSPVAHGTGELVFVARAYGQHVFTRPTVKPPAHRVTELADPELPRVPETHGTYLPPEQLLVVPEGAEALDSEPRVDPTPILFGLMHTDGNRHVNFLTYPRLVEEAALRRLAEHGHRSPVLGRRIELGYRKPSFAGDRVFIASQAWRRQGAVGLVAAFIEEESVGRSGTFTDFGRARCAARIELSA